MSNLPDWLYVPAKRLLPHVDDNGVYQQLMYVCTGCGEVLDIDSTRLQLVELHSYLYEYAVILNRILKKVEERDN